MLERNPGADLGWLWQVKDLPALPHPAHLTPLMATHGFQEALKDQRDLRFLQGNLGRWANDLQVFDTMLATRRARFAANLPAAQQQTHRQRQQRLVAEQTALTQALVQADGPALADARERALLERLARVRTVLATAPADEAGDALRERARRVAGALEWQLSQALPERLWAAKKALRGTEADLANAAARDAALQAAQRDEPSRFDGFAQRIAALRTRVATLTPQVAALRQEQQASVQALAVQALREQQARLGEYTTQARFALAQLQDRATVAKQDIPDAAR